MLVYNRGTVPLACGNGVNLGVIHRALGEVEGLHLLKPSFCVTPLTLPHNNPEA